jgi:hypothetical protein
MLRLLICCRDVTSAGSTRDKRARADTIENGAVRTCS